MAVALTMVRMKTAVLRHSMTGQRAQLVVTGGILGVALAAGTIMLAVSAPDLLPAAYAVWMLGWMLGPVFSGGGDETLRPEYFTLLGLPPRRLAAGLLAAAFVGVAPAISLLALLGLVVAGVRLGIGPALVSVPAAVLELVVFVLLSKVAVAVMGVALRSRVGAVLAGVINGAVLAVLGQGWVFAVAYGESGGVPSFVDYLPSGWGMLAVRGGWGQAALGLAASALLALLLLAAWAALLTRRAGATRPPSGGRRRTATATPTGHASAPGDAGPAHYGTASAGGMVGANAAGAAGAGSGVGGGPRGGTLVRAVLGKELRTWSRDLVRTHQLTFALAYGLVFAGAPLLLGWYWMLPWAGAIFVVMAAGMSANLYSGDGTALWLTIMTPGARDVRGRQLAWLLTVGPIGLVLTVVLTAVADGPWPVVLATVVAALGGGAGLVPLLSVYALVPGTDPHRRAGNPLRWTEDESAVSGLAFTMLGLSILAAAPALVVAVTYGWAGVAVGVVTGALYVWGFGLLAERRIQARGPELLDHMRTGRPPTTGAKSRMDDLPKLQGYVSGLCLGFGSIPLFPQGVVPAIFKITGVGSKGWFLALYLPEWLQWPTIVFMALLGLTMYAVGAWIPYRSKRRP
jgi:ABC-2 type transport system permease protein